MAPVVRISVGTSSSGPRFGHLVRNAISQRWTLDWILQREKGEKYFGGEGERTKREIEDKERERGERERERQMAEMGEGEGRR